MSQEDFASMMNTNQQQIWRWESGQTKPNSDTVARMAKVLGVSTDYLLGVSDEQYQIYEKSDLSPMEQRLIGALRAGRVRPAAKFFAELLGDDSDDEFDLVDEEAEIT